MSSNAKSLTIALVASLLIFGGIFAAVLWMLNRGPSVQPIVSSANSPEKGVEPATPVPAVEPVARPTTPIETVRSEKQELRVRVVEETTETPIREARLIVMQAQEGGRAGDVVYQSPAGRSVAADGVFSVSLVSGTYRVQAQAHGYRSETAQVQILKDKGASVVLALSRGLSISGTIYDAKRKPIAGAVVRGYKEIGSPDDDMITRLIGLIDIKERSREMPAQTTSGPDGTYQLDGLDEVYYTVTAMAGGFSPRSRVNIRPSARNIDVILPEGSIYRGMVTDMAGQGLEGATVSVYPHVDTTDIIEVVQAKARPPIESVRTDSSGNFEITTLGTGLYNLQVKAPGYQPRDVLKEVVNSGENPFKTFQLKDGLEIAGRVVDAEGQPIPGARVKPVKVADPANRQQPMFISFDDGGVDTDEDGRFLFDSLESGKYSILASHNDYASKQLRDVEIGSTRLTITLDRGGAISGRITRQDTGAPIPGARVIVNDLMDVKKEGIADESGHYFVGGLNSRRGKRLLTVQADGFSRISNESVTVRENQETTGVDYALLPTASVVGRVVDTNGNGIASARVTAKRKSKTGYPVPVGSAVTDQKGTYTINLEGGEETWLSVMSSRFLETNSAPFVVEPGQQISLDDVVLNMGGAVRGQVVDEIGRGVEGAMVSIRSEGDTDFSYTKNAKTDRKGEFVITGLNAGPIDLKATSNHYLDAIVEDVQVVEGDVSGGVRLSLRRGNRLVGRVMSPDGRPVQGATVTVREYVQGIKEHREQTDAQGRFALESLLSKEPVELEVNHGDYSSYASESVPVSEEEIEIRLEPLGSIGGRVVDPGGRPVTAFSVQPNLVALADGGAGQGDRVAPRTFTSSDGGFKFPGLSSGTYDVSVGAAGYSSRSVTGVVVENGRTVDLGDVVLQEGGIVDGVVVDTSNRPISGVAVQILGGPAKFVSPESATSKIVTDSTGRFVFRNLKDAERLTLRATLEGYVREDVSQIDTKDASSCRDLRVVLAPGGEISGVVLGVNGQPRAGVSIYLAGIGDLRGRPGVNQTARSDNGGRFSFVGLRPGDYRVTAHRVGNSDNPALEVRIEAGTFQEVEMIVD